MYRTGWFLPAVILTAISVRGAFADEPAATTRPTKYALLIGINEYPDPAIRPRRHAEADTQALYDLITDPAYLGVPKENVTLLLGSADGKRNSQPATRANILQAFGRVTARANKDDLVIISMVGQGASVTDRTCFFAVDSTFKDRAKTAVTAPDLEHQLEKFSSENLCVLLDIGLKGFDAGKEVVAEPNVGDLLRVFVGPEDKDEHTLPQGRVIVLANNTSTPSLDLPEQGLFMRTVLDALRGKADEFGYEPDGRVTVGELETYLERELPKAAREIGRSREEKQQTPFVYGAKTSHFALTHNPAVMPKVNQRLERLGQLGLTPEQRDEGRRLLSQMPKLRREQQLRKLYQQLTDGTLDREDFVTARAENLRQRELSKEAAAKFAEKVYQGVLTVRSGYVKDLSAGEMTAWAIQGLYRRLDEKLPDDLKERLDRLKDQEANRRDLLNLLVDARLHLGQREDLDNNKDVDLALLMMMVLNLDPYTVYIDKDTKDKAEIDFKGQFTGIGIQINRDLARDGLLVVTPIKNSPAYKAGVKTGDLIVEINTDMDKTGKPMATRETISTKGLKTEDAVKRILGKAGTKVRLKVEREGASQPLEFEITRGRVEVETVLGARRNDDDSWDFMYDAENKIGYIRLTQFSPGSARDVETAVKKLLASGMKGLVLDLRGNPGGLLQSAVEISDMFIDDGLIVTIKPRVGEEQQYGGNHAGSYLNFPMVCLINGGSASGSEIVAACLQDHERAIVIGDRSYGKGSVQTIHQFRPTEGEIKMTTASFWRPNGKNLNKSSTKGQDDEDWGVRPDEGYEVKLDSRERFELSRHLRELEILPRRDGPSKEPKPEFKDRQLDKGLEYLRDQIRTAARVPMKKAG